MSLGVSAVDRTSLIAQPQGDCDGSIARTRQRFEDDDGIDSPDASPLGQMRVLSYAPRCTDEFDGIAQRPSAGNRVALNLAAVACVVALAGSARLFSAPGSLVASDGSEAVSLAATGMEDDGPAYTYNKLANTFCQNIGATRLDRFEVDEDECREKCDQDVRCVAFQMFQATDCSLLTGCPKKGRSNIGSFIMEKSNSLQDLLSQAMSSLHASPPDERPPVLPPTQGHIRGHFLAPDGGHPVIQHEAVHQYDCVTQVEKYQTAWSDEQKEYCCNHYYDGCPGYVSPEVHGVAVIHPTVARSDPIDLDHHHEQLGPAPFDCHNDVATWETSWNPDKKSWCCNVYYNGCPSPDHGSRFDCESDVLDWPTRWAPEQKEYCCHNAHVGCEEFECEEDAAEPLDAWSPRKSAWCCAVTGQHCPVVAGEEPAAVEEFECGIYSEDFKTAWSAWSAPKQAWCCVKKGVACPDAPTTTTAWGGGPTSTTAFPPLFDCDADFGSWMTSWAPGKMAWCCDHAKRGCVELPGMTTTTPFPEKFQAPSPATVAPGPLPMTTTTPFVHTNPATQAPWQPTAGPVTMPMTTTTPFLQKAQVVAPVVAPTGGVVSTANQYDCNQDFINWQAGWQPEKKAWCCEFELRGCEARASPSPAPATTTVPMVGVPFNCYVEAPSSWTYNKQEWCCQNKGCCENGCPASTQVTSTTPYLITPQGPAPAPSSEWTTTTNFANPPNGPVQFPSFGLPSLSLPSFPNPFAGPGDTTTGPGTTTKLVTTTKPAPQETDGPTTTPFGNWVDLKPDTTTTPVVWFTSSKKAEVVIIKPVVELPATTTTEAEHRAAETTTRSKLQLDVPNRAGWELHMSTSCKEALEFLQSDACDAEVLLGSIQRTCPVKSDAAKEACSEWFGHIEGMSEQLRAQEVQRCQGAVERTSQAAMRMPEVGAANKEEQTLCFKCEVACFSKTKPVPFTAQQASSDSSRPGARWSPDGSGKHCRPRAQNGEVSGVQKRARKDASTMTQENWSKLSMAMNQLKTEGKLEKYATMFSEGMPPEDPTFMNFQNLPWFRHFLFDFETDLQVVAKDCDLTLPYWSGCNEASSAGLRNSQLWEPSHLGGKPTCQGGGDSHCEKATVNSAKKCDADADRWCLGDGIAGGWQITGSHSDSGCSCVNRSPGSSEAKVGSCAMVLPVFRMMEDFKSLSEAADGLRATMHCGEAAGKESTMCTESIAVWDPLFWLDYAYLDRIFFGWQKHHQMLSDIDTTNCYGCEMHMTHYHVPLSDWFGKHSEDKDCDGILVPKSDPQACITYLHATIV